MNFVCPTIVLLEKAKFLTLKIEYRDVALCRTKQSCELFCERLYIAERIWQNVKIFVMEAPDETKFRH